VVATNVWGYDINRILFKEKCDVDLLIHRIHFILLADGSDCLGGFSAWL